MDEEAVREYVEQAQSVIEASPQMDEANTKAAILRDFIELLGWKIPMNTQLEYSVEAFGQTYKVDYALIIDETPVAFLEAKGVDTALIPKHDKQLSSYMMNKNVSYGILTNGKQYRFFQRRVNADDVEVQKVGGAALDELPDQIPVLEAYTKNAIETGESGKILGRINELREARQTLEAEKDDLATELSGVLADRVSDTISSIAESQSKELIDRVIVDIENEIDPDGTVSTDRGRNEIQQPVPEASKDVSGEYIIELQDNGSTLATFADDTQTDVMTKAVNCLVENYDLISKIEPVPYIPGREKAIINDSPTSPHDEDAMRTYRELSQGYYLDTHMSKDAKKRHLKRLVDKCNLDVEFEGEW